MTPIMTHLERAIRWIFITMLALAAFYGLAAWLGGLVLLNRNAVQPADGIPVYLMSNGVHIDLVLPVSGPCQCDRLHAPTLDVLEQPFDARVPRHQWHWLAVGWGDAAFMLTVPTWADLKPGIALRAVTGLDASVVRLSSYEEPVPGATVRRLLLSPVQYQRLRDYVRRSLVLPPQERTSALAGPEDRFYLSRDRYSLLLDCNQWVARGLAHAGVRAPLWSPFAGALLRG